ncbi:response regulator [bacterium]|nr:MAG: response regulator [bacterium]
MSFIEPVKDLFITESKELLEKVEQVTLVLETVGNQQESLREMFRCIHSIKGSSGMFGFEAIEYFLHHFENLLDEMRNGNVKPTKDVVDLLLKSVDYSNKLIAKPGASLTKAQKNTSDSLIKKMNAIVNGKVMETEPPKQQKQNTEEKVNKPAKTEIDVKPEVKSQPEPKVSESVIEDEVDFHEGFIVEITITPEGVEQQFDPGYILDELKEMGAKTISFIPGKIPDLLNYDPHKTFGRWVVQLPGSFTEEEIDDIFTFVENELDYTVESVAPKMTEVNDFDDEESPENDDFENSKEEFDFTEEEVKVSELNLHEELVNEEVVEQFEVEEEPEADEADVEQGTQTTQPSEQQSSIRVNIHVLEDLLNLVSELVLNRNQFMQLALTAENHQLNKHINQLNRLTSEIQETAMRTRMQAIGTSWTRLPRIVRDLSAELGKEVELKMEGESTELDRQVMQHISEPMVHLLRNALDHGIETPDIRIKKGKSAKGRIRLNAYHRGGHIIVEISDDGKGIDVNGIKSIAITKGLTTKEQAEKLNPQQILDFLFHPGFSTAAKVTKISGRGVGLDVVKKHIEELGGSVELQSEFGSGSLFRIKIPLTLAIISALIVRSGDHYFAIPEIAIQELVWLNEENLGKVIQMQGNQVLSLRNTLLPLVSLKEVLQKKEQDSIENNHIVVIQNGDATYGLIVDQVDQIQEIVVKPLNRLLKNIPVYSGTTLIGSEQIVLILDVNGVAQLASLEQESYTKTSNSNNDDANLSEDKTLFLLFKHQQTQKAVHLGLVARLEELSKQKVEEIDNQYFIQYRERILPLIEFKKGIIASGVNPVPVIVFQTEELSFGLVVEGFHDIAEEAVKFEQISKKPGILGIAVLNEKSTEIIDVNWFFQQVSLAQHHVQMKEKGLVNVLIAEKSDFLRNHMKSVIQAAGMHAITVSSKKDALSSLKKHAIQIVLSGLELNDSDGFMLASEIHRDKSIPAMIILSIASNDISGHPQRDQFTAHITGYDKDIIMESLQKVLSNNGLTITG